MKRYILITTAAVFFFLEMFTQASTFAQVPDPRSSGPGMNVSEGSVVTLARADSQAPPSGVVEATSPASGVEAWAMVVVGIGLIAYQVSRRRK